jgi:hypothetical protein
MRQHENVTTTEDIANSTRGAVDEPRTETDRIDSDPIDSDRTDADRVETDRVDSERGDFDSPGLDRTDSDRTDFGRTDSDRSDFDRAEAEDREYDQDHTHDDRITEVDESARPADTTLTGEKPPTEQSDAAADVLFDEADATRFRTRWSEVQASFVDDPKRAVQDADVLVAELMQSVASAFSQRKHLLEEQWQQGTHAETEDLRLALRGYRSFLDQLLAR